MLILCVALYGWWVYSCEVSYCTVTVSWVLIFGGPEFLFSLPRDLMQVLLRWSYVGYGAPVPKEVPGTGTRLSDRVRV